MTDETITIENPSPKLLKFVRALRENQEKRILELKEKFKNGKEKL
jgi:hypothetical protein